MIEYAKKIGKELKIIQVSDEKAPPKAKFCAIIAEGDLNKNQLAKLRKEIVDVIDDLVKKGYTNFVTLASNHTEVFIAGHIALSKTIYDNLVLELFFPYKNYEEFSSNDCKKIVLYADNVHYIRDTEDYKEKKKEQEGYGFYDYLIDNVDTLVVVCSGGNFNNIYKNVIANQSEYKEIIDIKL